MGGTTGWAGHGPGGGSRLAGAGGEGHCCLTVSKSVCALHSLVFTEDKRGARGSPGEGGLAWWGRGLKLDGDVRGGRG